MRSKLYYESLNYFIDESLSEKPIDSIKFLKHINDLETRKTDNDLEEGKLRSKIGVLYKIYGDLNQSEQFLKSSLLLLNADLNPLEYYTSRIRLAQTFQKQKRIPESLSILNHAEEECLKNRKLESLTDFVYQHKAKVYFDDGDYTNALKYFSKALKLREEKSNEELIESTAFAIEITLEKMSSGVDRKA